MALCHRGYARSAAHVVHIFFRCLIGFADFVRDEAVYAHLALRLVAVGGEIANAERFVDNAEKVVRGRVEGKAQVFGFQVRFCLRVVARDKEVVSAESLIIHFCKIERHAVGKQIRKGLRSCHALHAFQRFRLRPSIAKFERRGDALHAVGVREGQKQFVAKLVHVCRGGS